MKIFVRNFIMRVYPLSGTFMLTAMIGFLISAFFIYDLSPAWGFAFCLFFVLMFISSMISLSKAAVPEHISVRPEIYITGSKRKVKKKVRKKGKKKRKKRKR